MNRPFDWFVACTSVRPPMGKERHHTTTFMSAPSLPVDSTPSCEQCRMRSCLFYLCNLWGRRQAAPFVCPIASQVEPDSFIRISNAVQLRSQLIST